MGKLSMILWSILGVRFFCTKTKNANNVKSIMPEFFRQKQEEFHLSWILRMR